MTDPNPYGDAGSLALFAACVGSHDGVLVDHAVLALVLGHSIGALPEIVYTAGGGRQDEMGKLG